MAKRSETLQLAEQLINIHSITPNDNGCQDILNQRLKALGFHITDLSSKEVRNTYAQLGDTEPLYIFSGHTDVVPPGPENKWQTPPFLASVRDGKLYGRGAADMKGALAAMIVSVEQFLEKTPAFTGSIGFMITSDEEGEATDGTLKIVEHLIKTQKKIQGCIIGEASSSEKIGDAIKIGRRGSLHGYLKVIGKQGHIAYPQLADNPIHRCFKALDELTQLQWDQGNDDFTPTSFQIYNINADTGASNVIPGALTARFNFRYAPSSTADELKQKVHKILDNHQLQYEIDWQLMSEPFLSQKGSLTKAAQTAIKTICAIETYPNTTGGTSDGRFIAKTGCEIIELGVVNKCIHQINEHVNLEDLETLTKLYETILHQLYD